MRSHTRILSPTFSRTFQLASYLTNVWGSFNFDLPTPVCENYVRPFPPSGNPNRSPITIGERVLEQELPNDSQGSPFLCLRLFLPCVWCSTLILQRLYPTHKIRRMRTAYCSPLRCVASASFIFQKNSCIASLGNITNGFKSRHVSASRNPKFLSGETKRNMV
jgi:hypothetical protein